MEQISTPFSEDAIQYMNERQIDIDGGMPTHPFTCANRSDGVRYPPPDYRSDYSKATHGLEGGDIGVLIATPEGWVCPHCDYTQHWAHEFMATPTGIVPEQVKDIPALDALFRQEVTIEKLNKRLAAYQELADKGKRGADVMVRCIQRKIDSMSVTA